MDTPEPKAVSETHHSWNHIHQGPPQYQKIAWDIAARIAEGDYHEGDRLHSRSGLAGQYQVSSETARRAICILDDLGIVKAVQGSGVVVVSTEKAIRYVRQYHEFVSLTDLRSSVLDEIGSLQRDASALCGRLDQLVECVGHFKASNPFVPFHFEVPPDSPQLGKTLQELNFWHNTQATVIAVQRAGELQLSPGPYISLQPEDILYFIGNSECVHRVVSVLSR